MLHVDIPTRADIERLIAVRSPASVSIYVPTTPVTPHGEKSRIELKNQCAAAVGQLRDKGVDKRLILEVEESIGDLIEDDEFWRFQANSLAVLATPERTITFRLPTRVGPALEVSDRLHIKPLLRAVAVPQTAYVLALALGSVRLVEVSAELPAQTVKVEGMPASAPSSVGRSSLVKRGPLGSLQGVEAQNVWMRQYSRQIDNALRDLLAGREIPLILAATEPLNNMYRSVNTYPHLAQVGIPGNPEKTSDHDLAAASRSILDSLFKQELASVREQFSARTGENRTSTDIAQVARAATYGIVSTLLVDIDEIVPGTVDDEGRVIFADGQSASTYGVVDQIAGRALVTGARVLGVRRDDIPGGKSLAAIFRYSF
jgi:hypothetical protein